LNLFLSYASEDKVIAEEITHSLRSRGHTVFFDRLDLPPGEQFEKQIEEAIAKSDLFIFLISTQSVTDGRFTRTELLLAEKRWPVAHNNVLPVMIKETPFDQLTPYLKSVTILEPKGNIPAEVGAAVDNLKRFRISYLHLLALLFLCSMLVWYFVTRPVAEVALSVRNAWAFERGLFDDPEKFNIGITVKNSGSKAEVIDRIYLETEPTESLQVEKLGNLPAERENSLLVDHGEENTGFMLVSEVSDVTPDRWRICADTADNRRICSYYLHWNPNRDFLYGDYIRIDETITNNSVAVAWDGANYLIATTSPNMLFRISEQGSILNKTRLEGIPVSLSVGNKGIYIGLQNPDSLKLLDFDSLDVQSSKIIRFDESIRGDFGERASTIPNSIAQDGENIWVLTGGRAGAEVLSYFDADLTSQKVPDYYEDVSFELAGMDLVNADGFVWSGQMESSPASIYRFGVNSFTTISGHDYEIVSCATGVLPLSTGVLFPECSGQVSIIHLQEDLSITVGKSIDYISGFGNASTDWQNVRIASTDDNKLIGAVSVETRDDQLQLVSTSVTLSTLDWVKGSSIKFKASDTRINALAVGEKSALLIVENAAGRTQLISPKILPD